VFAFRRAPLGGGSSRPDVSLIAVVDDDDCIRESLQGLLESIGFAVETFPSARSFLDSACLTSIDCLILDVRMPGMRGPDLQRELTRRECRIPIVFITAHGDEDIRPRVLSEGAVDCLLKPFSEEALLSAIRSALPPG
jgi:FixJ family two-component response regulator